MTATYARNFRRVKFVFKLTIFLIFVTVLIILATKIKTIRSRASAPFKLPDVVDFFPEINNDLSKISWGHAINSKSLLKNALSTSKFNLLTEFETFIELNFKF